MLSNQIFIVDDDPDNLDILVCSISDENYDITTFTDPRLCLEAIEKGAPDLIISDVNMPHINGFELCKSIRAEERSADTPVIFLSALDDVHSIMQGYDAGGMDYLTKPYRPQELITKINKNLDSQKKLNSLNRKAKSAKKIAFEAMNDAERVNIIVRFMEDCVRLNQLEPISRKLFGILHPMGLRSSILVFSQGQELYFSDDQLDKPLEKRLLQKVHEGLKARMETSGRLYEFNGRMIVSFEHLSLLIRNYDSGKHGHLLDFLAGLLNGVEMKIFAVEDAINNATLRRQEADHLLIQAKDNIEHLHSALADGEKHLLKVMTLLMSKLNKALDEFSLTAEQKTSLSSLMEESMEELVRAYTAGVDLETPLSEVLDDLQDFIIATIDPANNIHIAKK